MEDLTVESMPLECWSALGLGALALLVERFGGPTVDARYWPTIARRLVCEAGEDGASFDLGQLVSWLNARAEVLS
jgi:hypothetical protein